MSSSLQPYGTAKLLRPWGFPGKNTGVGCHFLHQEILPTQGLNSGLPHCRQTLYPLSHQKIPLRILFCNSSIWLHGSQFHYFLLLGSISYEFALHSLIDGHLVGFQILVIIYKEFKNSDTYLFGNISFFFFFFKVNT